MRNRRDFLKTSGMLFSAALCGGALSENALGMGKPLQNRQPNILLITADDLGIEIGCYGDKQVQTPNIDALAKNGTSFETGWVTMASCSPSRSSIHTGLYPHQNGQIGLCHRGYSMNKEYPTISTVLKDAGYRTAILGKFHIEPKSACEWDFKFQETEACVVQRDVKEMAEQADDFLASSDDKPFFMMMNYIDPHRPLHNQRKGLPEKPLTGDDIEPFGFLKVDTPEVREEVAGYYNCVNRLDTGVGMLMDKLKARGKLENTVVIFVGDHGSPFTRAKTTCYDMGLRVPFIISSPAMFKKGQVSRNMVSTIDIMPTVLDIINIYDLPSLPGRSLLPDVRGEKVKGREYLFGEYNTHQQFSWFPRRTVRTRRYQLIENLLAGRENPIKGVDGCSAFKASRQKSLEGTKVREAYDRYNKPPRYELYDLKKDPYCFENLADKPDLAGVKQELISALDKWRQQTNDPLVDPDALKQYTERHDNAKKLDSDSLPEGYLKGLPGLK